MKIFYLWVSVMSGSYKELVEDSKENETIVFVVQYTELELQRANRRQQRK